jgi:transposase-like protein
LQAALEAEVTEYLERQKYARQAAGEEFRGYRNGVGKERSLTVGSGTIKLQVPRVADVPADQEPFASQLVKPYQRRSQSLDEVFPKLFLEGLATRDFEPALRSLLGAEAPLSREYDCALESAIQGRV